MTGTFEAKEFIYKGFILKDSTWDIAVRVKDIDRDIKLFGKGMIGKGVFLTQKVSIDLGPGAIEFSGPWNKPRFDLSGSSTVEKTRIKIGVKGTLEAPELRLSSSPPYSREKLMAMLATGKSWQSVEDTLNTGVLSPDLTKDFIDYFVFAGKANAFARRFGIREVMVTLNGEAKGVGVKKDLTEKLGVGYSVEQRSSEKGESTVSQKVESAYQLTDKISVGVEKEVVEERSEVLDENVPATKNSDKVYFEYKKEF
jgi:hypothetical protein